MKEIMYDKKSFFALMPEKKDAAYDYAKKYMDFLDNSKTERDAVRYTVKLAEKNGYTEFRMGDKLEAGGKYYLNNREKSIFLFRIGEEDVSCGVKILAAHIDSPRLDLKQRPLFEDGGMAFLKTHYYGGIRKYQWTAIALALHGIVVKKDESVVDVVIGEDESDPILYVNDLLPHLGGKQSEQPLGTAISGEQLNLLVGSCPLDSDSDAIKRNVMKLIFDKYGICEDDFSSAELCAVPAGRARDVGMDRS
ncbi:MAG: aminopeptidase, partial [Clostridia bacterium]|nr:aminopeptidase [Clostridia bacterium]